jgi:HlyD family secretion protein
MGDRVLNLGIGIGWAGLLLGLSLGLASCNRNTPNAAESPGGRRGAIPVDVAIARQGFLNESQVYIGTTRPQKEVVLRSRTEGRLLDLTVDVGDRVVQGQRVATLDDAILRAALLEAESEQATRQAEILQAQTQVNTARTAVEQARLTLQQQQADAARLTRLYRSGAISQQAAEQARTEANTAAQALRSAQMQVRDAQQAVVAAQGRLKAQMALVAQARERLSYGVVMTPLTGVVMQRLTETGSLLQPGGEIISLGDLSQIKVVVELADVALGNIRLGQPASLRLDALPNQTFTGRVQRISPLASNTARLVPVEVVIANPSGQIGSGLLARVQFQAPISQTVVIPLAALSGGAEEGGGPRRGRRGGRRSRGGGAPEARESGRPDRSESPDAQPSESPQRSPGQERPERESPAGERPEGGRPDASDRPDRERPERGRPDREQPEGGRPDRPRPEGGRSGRERPERENSGGGRGGDRPGGNQPDQGTVFVVTGSDRRFKVEARKVRLGRQGNGRVEIRSGLLPGERFVVRAGRPLKDGARVRVSILSESPEGSGPRGRER